MAHSAEASSWPASSETRPTKRTDRVVTDGTYCGTKIYDDASGELRTYFTGDETFAGTVAHNADGVLAVFDVSWWGWIEEETDKAASLPVTLRITCEEDIGFSWSELFSAPSV